MNCGDGATLGSGDQLGCREGRVDRRRERQHDAVAPSLPLTDTQNLYKYFIRDDEEFEVAGKACARCDAQSGLRKWLGWVTA